MAAFKLIEGNKPILATRKEINTFISGKGFPDFEADFGWEYEDSSSGKRYRQTIKPRGQGWKAVKVSPQITKEVQTIIDISGFLSSVFVDGTTIVGDGTPSSPLASIGVDFTWEVISTDTHQLENNKGYIVDNVNLCVLTLPVTSAQGDLILVVGKSSNGWQIGQNTGQQIFVGNISTLVGVGNGIESTSSKDCVELVCITTDTEYSVRNTSPNTTIGTFVPFPLPDLLWLDSALGVTESGGAVSAWADQSGAANDFTQGTAANKPTLTAGALNGLPIIRFDGVDDSMNAASIVLPDAAQTIFFVAKANSVHDGSILSTYGGTGFLIRYLNTAGVLNMRFFDGTPLDGVVADSGGYNLFSIKVLGTTGAAATNTIYEDGISIASSSTATTAHAFNLKIGDIVGGGLPLNGDIAEIMCYTTGLSDADRGDVENYLMTKYAL